MNAFSIASVVVRPVRLPLVRPFVTALGAKSHSDNVWVRVRLTGGAEGWGEASSSLANPLQTGQKMAAALRRLGRMSGGRDVRDLASVVARAWSSEAETPAAVGALECALTDALCRAEGVSFCEFFGGARREIKTLMSISSVDPDVVGARVRAGQRRGFDGFKLKLNGREPLDLNRGRVRRAHQAAPKAALLLDPNQSFLPDSLAALTDALRQDGIRVSVIEEPFQKRDWSALRVHRRASSRDAHRIPILLDESIQTPADAVKAAREGLSDGVNVKLAKSGLLRGRRIIEAFRRRPGAMFMIGCMCESKIGLAAAVHFAMGTGAFDYADLDSDLLLKVRPVAGGYVRRGPWVTLPKKRSAGLGVVP